MEENYINYLSSYPNIERALKDGAKMHCFLSGGGLRVVVVKNDNNDVTYGEHPYFPGALAHAEEDFGLSYEEQYGGENAKHTHYLTGAYPLPYDAFDVFIKSGRSLDIVYSKSLNSFICTTDLSFGKVQWGSSSSILPSIVDCLLFGVSRIEEKENFSKRIWCRPSFKKLGRNFLSSFYSWQFIEN